MTILENKNLAPAPSCAKRLSFTNFGKGDSDLNGFWRHVIIDGKVQENEGFPYYQQEGSNLVMWWMWHGDVGHWVVNVTPGIYLKILILNDLIISDLAIFKIKILNSFRKAW